MKVYRFQGRRDYQNYLKSQSKIVTKENRKGELMRFVANISKAQLLLDYNPTTTIRKGLRETINWYLQNARKKERPQIGN